MKRQYVPVWRQVEPYRHTLSDHLRDAGEIVAGLVVFSALLFGIPFLLWLVAA